MAIKLMLAMLIVIPFVIQYAIHIHMAGKPEYYTMNEWQFLKKVIRNKLKKTD